MERPSLSSTLKASIVAGLLAGLAVALFHFLATEPVIQSAIELEERVRAAAGEVQDVPLVSREAQRVGLWIGFLLYGLTWALLFGVFIHTAWDRLPGTVGMGRIGVGGLLGMWTVGILPFLKYPANPPGVGDPETIGYRQALYLVFLALSVGGTVLALWANNHLARSAAFGKRVWIKPLVALGGYVVYAVALYLAVPPNPDPIRMPGDVVMSFRALSLAGLVLFWVVLGLSFGFLCREPASASVVRNAASRLPAPEGR